LAFWWRQFRDPLLDGLVRQALQDNHDLAAARARLLQARAQWGVTAGGLWPRLSASGGNIPVYSYGDSTSSNSRYLYQAGLDASWELDLFGGQRRNLEAAQANTQAAEENLRDVQVSLVAEVAMNYLQLRGYQQQVVIGRSNLEAQRRSAELTRQLLGVGFRSALDVANAEASVATTQSQIPLYESSAAQAIHALALLVGRPPGDLLAELSPWAEAPSPPDQAPPGLPSELLRRRPDIRRAEAQLHAATASIGVATADLYPKFSLTGSLSWRSGQASTWLSDSYRSLTAGPSFSWNLFQGGAVMSNIEVQEALRDQAWAAYQKAVLGALREVESALVALDKERERRQSLGEAVTANRRAVDLSLRLYREGQSDFLNVLTAQRSLYSVEDALVQSERTIATNMVALFKALGGGWDPAADQRAAN
jgi:NodT family efflux transporter outer membrane factor (OMF) lipoprotein